VTVETEGKPFDPDVAWPKPGERAFVKVAGFRGAWAAKNTDERLYRMIKGFHEAGDLIVAESRWEPRSSLNLLFPAIFAYRHSRELRLKYLVMAYGPLAGEKPDHRTHDLRKLWMKCRRIVLYFEGGSEPSDKDAFDAVGTQIAEFAAVDAGSDAFRFAHNTLGQSIQLAITEIDLIELKKVVASIHNFLECLDLHLHHGYGVPRCAH
jgi:hypothetical protein